MAKSAAIIQKYLEEVEKAAEDIISDQQEIITLDKRRNGNREALRQFKNNQDTNTSKSWICIGNMFILLSKKQATSSIEREQVQLNEEINNLRNNLRKKVDYLNELEGKEPTRGSRLVALSSEEWAAVKQTLGS